jgi:opacity protein-like surface antigen
METTMRRVIFVCLMALSMAAPGYAQDKKYDINLGGGWIFPTSDFKNDFNTGGQFVAGATFWITPTLGIEGDYNYARMSGPSKTITVSPIPGGAGSIQNIDSNHQIHAGVFDVVARSHNGGMVNGYFLGGIGIYHRIIQLTSPAVGYATVCDPYWLICYPAAVPVTNILGDRSSNDFGINFGGGVNFGHHTQFFIEARYHYVWGPTINPPAGTSATATSSNMTYFPLMFGVKF